MARPGHIAGRHDEREVALEHRVVAIEVRAMEREKIEALDHDELVKLEDAIRSAVKRQN